MNLNTKTIEEDVQLLKIAKVIHNVNRAYCQSIGDNSQPTWENAAQQVKNSIINGIKAHLENPELTPEQSHENWMKIKTEEGWKYGEEKSFENKTHPCYLPYMQLPEKQRTKDYLFKEIINSIKSLV